ncbi:MAG: hypothetical protein CXB60_07360 [Spiroplasma poulsonii]|nr:hypothetical protein [Spiroplasma poulsonii]
MKFKQIKKKKQDLGKKIIKKKQIYLFFIFMKNFVNFLLFLVKNNKKEEKMINRLLAIPFFIKILL